MKRPTFRLRTAGLVAVVLTLSGCGGGGQDTTSRPGERLPQISDRGPGMLRHSESTLQLPVPRTFELTHVEPKLFAAALGQDPARIFEFVRDQIGYELYSGYLRGPRGTLLGRAGNSVDRAALLAALLQTAGQRVRFARGLLPATEARELVTSMWLERPQPEQPKGDLPPGLKAMVQTFEAGVKRDFAIIRDQIRKAGQTARQASKPTLESLVEEARPHYWVQWLQGETWTDLDPSFRDAVPGRTYARAEETLDVLPDALAHRITIRVNVEEYTGDKPSTRTLLSYAAKAADLSGIDLILSHQPENWKGPARGPGGAISSAIESTGRVKPILVTAQEWLAGEPFYQRAPTGAGIGGVKTLLEGAGGRNPVPIATAEWIEFDFLGPNGRKETAIRYLFDVVGAGRRDASGALSEEEVGKRTEAGTAIDVAQGGYSIFFATGRIDPAHLTSALEAQPQGRDKPFDVRAVMRRINIAFAAASDGMMARLGDPERALVLFYPDTPRVQILELSTAAGRRRIALDLRRDQVRALALGGQAEDVFFAQIYRGVVNGTLERVLIGYLAASEGEKGAQWKPGASTSLLFERAQAEGVPSVLLTRAGEAWDGGASDDVRARVRREIAGGRWVLIPRNGVALDKEQRYAWWSIDPESGQTIAMTDEGLHQAVELGIVHVQTDQGEYFIVTIFVGGVAVTSFEAGAVALGAWIQIVMWSGWSLRYIIR